MKTKKIDIVNLFPLISDGDHKAFNVFYDVYYEQVFRFSYYFLKDKEACREVVSDVFFSIWQSRRKINEVSNMDAYLYTVAKNKSTQYIESKTNSGIISLNEIPIQLETGQGDSPEEKLFSREIDDLLTEVINELPERCRIIFLMARQEGLKTKEIAEILHINESTVRVQMKIAIDKIITQIKPHFPDITFTLFLFHIFSK